MSQARRDAASRESDAWEMAALEELRANLRLSAEERLRVAEALLAFAILTPHYRDKLDDPLARPDEG